ncbi:unnamed protein product [Cylicocyclus nassatus]|uniref:Major facilitator superfamily (MFS) profile domain-containing protein n=1 Tax=Cylicocyclus nassatus TaxID=53992 RepID=A0AA36GKH5_CYLNA|nr:unnamed protein product [Cylicocyclus nassatus]
MSTNFASSYKAEILIHYAEAKYEEYSRFAGHRNMATIYIHVLSIALCLSAGFQQGYIASVLNQPYLEITKFINDSWMERYDEPLQRNILDMLWSFLNVCFPIATIAGQFLAAYFCDHIGRKNTALLASAIYIPGVLLCTASKDYYPYFEQLFIGRILWSLANGINTVNATVWIIECAPTRIRGRMSAMQEFFLAFGSLVTQALGVPFSNEKLWPLIFVPNLAFVFVSMAMFAFVYESPQYILEKYGDEDRAKLALAAYYGVSITDRTLMTEIAICENCAREHEQTKHSKCGVETEHDAMTVMFKPWKAKDFTSRVVRRAAWLGVMVKVAYVFSGARCLRAFSTFALHNLGGWSIDAALYGSLVIGIARLPLALVPVLLVDRVGRRPLLLYSTLISLLSLIAMIVGIDVGEDLKIATLTGLATLLLINACGLGSVSRFYAAELVPRAYLLPCISTLNTLESLSKIAVEFAFYPIANIIGGQSLLLFIVPTTIFIYFMWSDCPESSRRPVNEVLNDIASKMKINVEFPSYGNL